MESQMSQKVKRKMPLKCPFCWRCFRYKLSREMHIKDDHTDLYQTYKTSDDGSDSPIDDFLKITSDQQQNNHQNHCWDSSWSQFAERHIKITKKKRKVDYTLVRPAISVVKSNGRNRQLPRMQQLEQENHNSRQQSTQHLVLLQTVHQALLGLNKLNKLVTPL